MRLTPARMMRRDRGDAADAGEALEVYTQADGPRWPVALLPFTSPFYHSVLSGWVLGCRLACR